MFLEMHHTGPQAAASHHALTLYTRAYTSMHTHMPAHIPPTFPGVLGFQHLSSPGTFWGPPEGVTQWFL